MLNNPLSQHLLEISSKRTEIVSVLLTVKIPVLTKHLLYEHINKQSGNANSIWNHHVCLPICLCPGNVAEERFSDLRHHTALCATSNAWHQHSPWYAYV